MHSQSVTPPVPVRRPPLEGSKPNQDEFRSYLRAAHRVRETLKPLNSVLRTIYHSSPGHVLFAIDQVIEAPEFWICYPKLFQFSPTEVFRSVGPRALPRDVAAQLARAFDYFVAANEARDVVYQLGDVEVVAWDEPLGYMTDPRVPAQFMEAWLWDVRGSAAMAAVAVCCAAEPEPPLDRITELVDIWERGQLAILRFFAGFPESGAAKHLPAGVAPLDLEAVIARHRRAELGFRAKLDNPDIPDVSKLVEG